MQLYDPAGPASPRICISPFISPFILTSMRRGDDPALRTAEVCRLSASCCESSARQRAHYCENAQPGCRRHCPGESGSISSIATKMRKYLTLATGAPYQNNNKLLNYISNMKLRILICNIRTYDINYFLLKIYHHYF